MRVGWHQVPPRRPRHLHRAHQLPGARRHVLLLHAGRHPRHQEVPGLEALGHHRPTGAVRHSVLPRISAPVPPVRLPQSHRVPSHLQRRPLHVHVRLLLLPHLHLSSQEAAGGRASRRQAPANDQQQQRAPTRQQQRDQRQGQQRQGEEQLSRLA